MTGEALWLLVIARLPFPVPSDPIVAARSEQFEQPFEGYAVPGTILTFKQGFGRLIRSRTDRGVVAVLDRRVLTEGVRAGRAALAAAGQRSGGCQAAELSTAVAGWLAPSADR